MAVVHSYRALRGLLLLLATIEAIGGVICVLGTGWVLSLAPPSFHLVSSGFVIAILKFVGVLALALAYLAYVTAQDPERYVAVIDAMAFLLLAAAAIDVYAFFALHAPFYPAVYVVIRTVVRVMIAIALLVLRPRHAAL